MASNAPSKIYFNYLAKKAIRDLERKNQRAGSALSLRGGAARKKQWALLRKIQQKRAAGGKKRGPKAKKGARKKRRRRRSAVGGSKVQKRRRGGRRKRRVRKVVMGAGRKKSRKRIGGRRKRKQGGRRRRKGHKRTVENMERYTPSQNMAGKPHQQMTGMLRASYSSPNALRSLSSQAFSNLQKTGLQRMSPLEIYKQRL